MSKRANARHRRDIRRALAIEQVRSRIRSYEQRLASMMKNTPDPNAPEALHRKHTWAITKESNRLATAKGELHTLNRRLKLTSEEEA